MQLRQNKSPLFPMASHKIQRPSLTASADVSTRGILATRHTAAKFPPKSAERGECRKMLQNSRRKNSTDVEQNPKPSHPIFLKTSLFPKSTRRGADGGADCDVFAIYAARRIVSLLLVSTSVLCEGTCVQRGTANRWQQRWQRAEVVRNEIIPTFPRRLR